jgi:hypothetical protein
MFKYNSLLTLVLSLFVFTACSSNEIGDSKDVVQDKIYQEYNINYTEGNTNAEVFCQFRFAGSDGTTLVLNAPSQLQFDGEVLKVDSNTTSGAYYKTTRPAVNFFGKHSLVFTNTAGKKLENSFLFGPFKLINIPASVSKQQSFNLNFEAGAFQTGDHIEIYAGNTDSSFSVSHTNAGNSILIPAAELKRQKGKQLTLEATLYRKIALQQNTDEGGAINIMYSLKPVTIKLTD